MLPRCIMRYGIAAGPITAGVLPGKTPLFDVWGKTVNLASRMESSGVPGRVQITEQVHRLVIKATDNPFTFDAKHKVMCKGFGSVAAYFVSTCSRPPPRDLLTQLAIKPNHGRFFFDSGIPAARLMRGTESNSHSGTGSTGDRQSVHSSASQHSRNSAL